MANQFQEKIAAALTRRGLSASFVFAALAAFASVADAAFEWIERPDDMDSVIFEDYDRYGDRVRLLYRTMPSVQQMRADPQGWANNVYVVEIDSEGRIEQRRLGSDQTNYAALVLRRNHDEIFVLIRSPETGLAERLERWSSADGNVVSSAPPPSVLQAGTSGPVPLVATEDGSLFIALGGGTASSASAAPARQLEWYKLAADGELERGQYSQGTDVLAVDGAFGAHDGGIGLFLRISAHRNTGGIGTDIPTPIRRSVGTRTLEATVGSEVRLLVSDTGAAATLSPALERLLIWGGELSPPQDLPFEQIIEQSAEQQRVMDDTELEYGARRSLVRSHNRTWSWPLIKHSGNGYAVLATVTANRDRDPPAAGPYLLEVGTDGALHRELYLAPLATAMDADFSDFLPFENDAVLLAGTRRIDRRIVGQVTLVDGHGQGEWTAELDAPAGPFDGIERNRSGIWLFGHGANRERDKVLFWVEHVEDNRQAKIPAPPAQREAHTSPALAVSPASTVESARANGCLCTCEEFAEFQTLMRQLGQMPAPGQPPARPDEAVTSKLMCASLCVHAYSSCPAR